MSSTADLPTTPSTATLPLTAYKLHPDPSLRLAPATIAREWINQTHEQFAKRCLPLLIANQAGWFILNSHRLQVTWDSGDSQDALTLEWQSGVAPYPALSHFGHGILTWSLPYLFRTPPGYQLQVRGPANWPKDGICALEGIVETDWTMATFTMNWKMTRPDHPVIFEVGEPVCMVVPTRATALEQFDPQVRDLASDPPTAEGFVEWSRSRSSFLADLQIPGSEAAQQKWQRDYFHGKTTSGDNAPEHRTNLKLRPFARDLD